MTETGQKVEFVTVVTAEIHDNRPPFVEPLEVLAFSLRDKGLPEDRHWHILVYENVDVDNHSLVQNLKFRMVQMGFRVHLHSVHDLGRIDVSYTIPLRLAPALQKLSAFKLPTFVAARRTRFKPGVVCSLVTTRSFPFSVPSHKRRRWLIR